MFDTKQADEIIDKIEDATAQMNALKKIKEGLELQLSGLLQDDVSIAMDGKAYGCGTTNFMSDRKEIKITIPKNVKWDQSKLASLYVKIGQSGEDPSQYIKTEYTVSEDAYKNWPSSIADVFEPARTVEAGKPKLEFKEGK